MAIMRTLQLAAPPSLLFFSKSVHLQALASERDCFATATLNTMFECEFGWRESEKVGEPRASAYCQCLLPPPSPSNCTDTPIKLASSPFESPQASKQIGSSSSSSSHTLTLTVALTCVRAPANDPVAGLPVLRLGPAKCWSVSILLRLLSYKLMPDTEGRPETLDAVLWPAATGDSRHQLAWS